jgi:hypothetical protein
MARVTVVSSLFPQLSGHSRAPFRVAFALAVGVLVIVAVAGLQAPVIAVSALAVPLLFLVYVFEIDPLEVRFAVPTALLFVAGAALGVGWGLLLGPLAADSLLLTVAAQRRGAGVRGRGSGGRPAAHGAARGGGAAVAIRTQRGA